MAISPQDFKNIGQAAATDLAAIFTDTLNSAVVKLKADLKAEEGIDGETKQAFKDLERALTAIKKDTGIVADLRQKILEGTITEAELDNAKLRLASKRRKVTEAINVLTKNGVSLSGKLKENFNDVDKNLDNSQTNIELFKDSLNSANKELSLTPTIVGGIGTLIKNIGIQNPFENFATNIKQSSTAYKVLLADISEREINGEEISDSEKDVLKTLYKQQSVFFQFGKSIDEATTSTKLLEVGIISIGASVGKINTKQVELRRLIGSNVTAFTDVNTKATTAVDLIETQVALTEQLGLNVNAAFSSETVQEVAELTKLFGLSSESANNLALFSEVTGDNLNQQTEALFKAIPNELNRRQIFEDIGQISSEISLRFQGDIVALGKAAANARKLGLTLQQVDQVAASLLDIESSITAEFEAELLTGKQLNLERARGFALVNDYEGLIKEIGNQEEIILSFATGNRIQQEAIAAAIGLSVPDLAKSVFLQQMADGASLSQAANVADIGLESAKVLSAQESIAASMTKLTQALAPVLEAFSSIAGTSAGIVTMTSAIAGIYGGRMLTDAAKFLATQMLLRKVNERNAFLMAMQSIGRNPLTAGLTIAALVGGGIAINSILKGNDIISPGYGKRTLLSPEGAIALNNDDTVIAGTNLGRNAGLSRGDIKAIASAVRDGASQANINLDGGRVSSRLQVPNVLNQRQYSI